MSVRVIAHIDMDAFFAAVEQRDNPSFKGLPVIIGADPKGGQGRGVVSTCSYEARRFGIHSAMPISTAYRKCPQGIFLPGNSAKYRKASGQIFTILHDFTPDVEPVSVDEAFMDLTGSYHFYQTPLRTCAAIKARIQSEVGLTASIGIAPNKMVAKIASDHCKPDGLLEILPRSLLGFLWPLPVGKLWGVGPQTQLVLHRLELRTIGALAGSSTEFLFEHLGSTGPHLYALANGIDPRRVHVDDEIKSVSHEHTFDVDVRDRKEIDKVLSALSEKVSRRLRKYGLKGKTVTLKVRFKDFKTFTRAHTFPCRVNFYEDLYQTVSGLFEEFYKGRAEIRLLGVRVSHFEDPYVRENLFEDPANEKRERIHAVVDVIKNKYGEKAICRAQNI